MGRQTRVLAGGVYFGEGPRWHDGRLWFSDFYVHQVKSVSEAGDARVEFEIDDRPSGLGWTPDGSMLIVSMTKRQVLRRTADGVVTVHADLNDIAGFHCNDMVVDAAGGAYVGNFGFDLDAEMTARGVQSVLADHPTRSWPRVPDGIALDADGAIWIANPIAPECARIAEGGEVLEVIETGMPCYACMLGGEDGRTLFMLIAPSSLAHEAAKAPKGEVVAARVDSPRAGRP
jgi:sugar lactone lactonase YvrE